MRQLVPTPSATWMTSFCVIKIEVTCRKHMTYYLISVMWAHTYKMRRPKSTRSSLSAKKWTTNILTLLLYPKLLAPGQACDFIPKQGVPWALCQFNWLIHILPFQITSGWFTCWRPINTDDSVHENQKHCSVSERVLTDFCSQINSYWNNLIHNQALTSS